MRLTRNAPKRLQILLHTYLDTNIQMQPPTPPTKTHTRVVVTRSACKFFYTHIFRQQINYSNLSLSLSQRPRSGVLRRQKLRSPLFSQNPELTDVHLKPGVGENIATHASPTFRNILHVLISTTPIHSPSLFPNPLPPTFSPFTVCCVGTLIKTGHLPHIVKAI